MKTVLVCGSRYWSDDIEIYVQLQELAEEWCLVGDLIGTSIRSGEFLPVRLIHGNCKGADRLAGEIAEQMRFQVESFPADWDRHGKAAGPIRNGEMLDERPDLVLAFGAGRGTDDMARKAEAAGIEVRRFARAAVPSG